MSKAEPEETRPNKRIRLSQPDPLRNHNDHYQTYPRLSADAAPESPSVHSPNDISNFVDNKAKNLVAKIFSPPVPDTSPQPESRPARQLKPTPKAHQLYYKLSSPPIEASEPRENRQKRPRRYIRLDKLWLRMSAAYDRLPEDPSHVGWWLVLQVLMRSWGAGHVDHWLRNKKPIQQGKKSRDYYEANIERRRRNDPEFGRDFREEKHDEEPLDLPHWPRSIQYVDADDLDPLLERNDPETYHLLNVIGGKLDTTDQVFHLLCNEPTRELPLTKEGLEMGLERIIKDEDMVKDLSWEVLHEILDFDSKAVVESQKKTYHVLKPAEPTKLMITPPVTNPASSLDDDADYRNGVMKQEVDSPVRPAPQIQPFVTGAKPTLELLALLNEMTGPVTAPRPKSLSNDSTLSNVSSRLSSTISALPPSTPKPTQHSTMPERHDAGDDGADLLLSLISSNRNATIADSDGEDDEVESRPTKRITNTSISKPTARTKTANPNALAKTANTNSPAPTFSPDFARLNLNDCIDMDPDLRPVAEQAIYNIFVARWRDLKIGDKTGLDALKAKLERVHQMFREAEIRPDRALTAEHGSALARIYGLLIEHSRGVGGVNGARVGVVNGTGTGNRNGNGNGAMVNGN